MVNSKKMPGLRSVRSLLLCGSIFFACFWLAAATAEANVVKLQDNIFPKTKLGNQTSPVSKDKPVLLTADEMDYDKENNLVIASGHVEIEQGDTIVLADKVTYNRNTGEVVATGNVSMMGTSGEVYFADKTSFEDNLKTGVIAQFKARLPDDSVAVATKAKKIDENTTELFNAAYTPCKCATDSGAAEAPVWSVKAEHMTLNQEDKTAEYENATFDVYDVPILYTPYFSHALPGAENESGLLTPTFLESRTLGAVYHQPVYFSFDRDKDLTLTPILTTKDGDVMATDYREKFDEGSFNFDGSLAESPDTDINGNHLPGQETRGDVDTKGAFNLTDDSDWGFHVRRASDITYLHLYGFSNDPLLTSRVYAEDFHFADSDRSYASVEGLSFQGLTALDNDKLIPVVAPLANVKWQSDPGVYDSRVSLEANTMSLYRVDGDDSRRLSSTARWELPYISDDGEVIQSSAQMRTDIYDVDNVTLPNGQEFNGVTGREVPQVSTDWRYPFISRLDSSALSSLTIEPIVNATVSPGGGNPAKIPNEDSQLPDFTDANLFSTDRFAGYDRIETGPRFSYGMRGQAQVYTDKYVDWLLGQQYRVINDPNFPIANDPTSHFSDYVGKVGLTYDTMSLAYRFRLDKDTLANHRSEVDAGYNAYPLTMNISYLSLNNDPTLSNRQVVTGTSTLNLTKEWLINASGSRDLLRDQTVTAYTGLGYKNECVYITSVIGKDYTSLQDIHPALTFWLKVSFKNLD